MISSSELAKMLSVVARGQHGKRDLSQTQAYQAYHYLLDPKADPLQLGAFLIAQRVKGESPAEIAGFVQAARSSMHHVDSITETHAIDMPCYAGKRRDVPLHMLAALEASKQGTPIVVHGLANIEGRFSAWQALSEAGVARASSLLQAKQLLHNNGIVYLDLEDICPALHNMLGLRPRLGVRSCANTVARLLNPLSCTAQINGFFHTPYGALMAQSNLLLGQSRSMLFMGSEGEPELYATRQRLLLLQDKEGYARWRYPSADVESYPRQKRVVIEIKQLFNKKLLGEISEKDRIVLHRMQQAFAWLHQEQVADDWLKDDEEAKHE